MTKEINLDELKAVLRERMVKEYGGVSKFLHSKDGERFGGMKIKPYLYSAGATSFGPLKALAEFFGVGTLSKKVIVERKTIYYVTGKD